MQLVGGRETDQLLVLLWPRLRREDYQVDDAWSSDLAKVAKTSNLFRSGTTRTTYQLMNNLFRRLRSKELSPTLHFCGLPGLPDAA